MFVEYKCLYFAFIFEVYIVSIYCVEVTNLFLPNTLKILPYNTVTCIVFCKKIVIFLYFVLFVLFLYSLALFQLLLHNLIMIYLGLFLFVLICFVVNELWFSGFHQVW